MSVKHLRRDRRSASDPDGAQTARRAAALVGGCLLSVYLLALPDAAIAGSAGAVFRAKADVDGRTSLNVNNHAYPDMVKKGDMVLVLCQESGGMAYGSTIWDRISNDPRIS